MYPNNTQQQNTLTVVTTATIQLNLDGTWDVIAFESDDKRQTKIDKVWVNNNHGMFSTVDEELETIKVGSKAFDELYPDDPAILFQELNLNENTKVRKIRAKETKQRKPRIRSHCKKCGMKGKNILTCLSTVDRKGNARSQHHRI